MLGAVGVQAAVLLCFGQFFLADGAVGGATGVGLTANRAAFGQIRHSKSLLSIDFGGVGPPLGTSIAEGGRRNQQVKGGVRR
jgi:hypothetical protein